MYSLFDQAPNGLRYPRVGGTRSRRFDGTRSKPRKLLENAATPTRRVHAVLGGDGKWHNTLHKTVKQCEIIFLRPVSLDNVFPL
jgi:hypothetical protein